MTNFSHLWLVTISNATKFLTFSFPLTVFVLWDVFPIYILGPHPASTKGVFFFSKGGCFYFQFTYKIVCIMQLKRDVPLYPHLNPTVYGLVFSPVFVIFLNPKQKKSCAGITPKNMGVQSNLHKEVCDCLLIV